MTPGGYTNGVTTHNSVNSTTFFLCTEESSAKKDVQLVSSIDNCIHVIVMASL